MFEVRRVTVARSENFYNKMSPAQYFVKFVTNFHVAVSLHVIRFR